MVTILGVGLAYFAIGKIQIHRATILACSVLSSGIIYLFGAFHYPRKLNALIQDFRESCHIANSPKARCKVFFLTGPSGVGKSTLRDYFCKRDCIEATSAFTTRPKRTGEHEIHRSISSRKFQQMLAKSQLCLIAENHGYNYGYLTADLETPSLSPIFIEVDSDTAVANSAKYGALILRVLPASVEDAQRIIRSQKADGMEDRLADLHRQTTPSFIEERKEAGDVIFINHYDAESLERFAELVETLTTPKTP
jgi:guanylate kinase